MSIDFSMERWEQVKRNTDLWWAGRLGRPLLAVTTTDRPADRPEPAIPARHVTAGYDFSISAEAVVDRWDYDLSRQRYWADAYPRVWPNFGAGVLAAFLGAEVEVDSRTVWFHAPRKVDIRDLHFEYDGRNRWLQRVKAIYAAAIDRWDGLVQLSMTDLGGALDVLSTFLPGEELLLALYDHPGEVRRLVDEIHELWHRVYRELADLLAGRNPGYAAWAGVFSTTPCYMLQCDFAYMIGPEMFDRFVRDELARSCERLDRSFYHLDGVGQLPHLQSLLAIEDLNGVQWIPGDGQPTGLHWMDVYAAVLNAGKNLWLTHGYGGERCLDAIAERTGALDRVLYIAGGVPTPDGVSAAAGDVEAFCARHGAV